MAYDGELKMAKGGMTNTFDNILLENGFKKIKTFAGVRFFQKGDIFASVDDILKEVRVETDDTTIYSGYSIADLLYILKQNKNLFSEKTMMAKGGKVKYDYLPKYEIESINTWDGENIEEKDILDGAYVKKSRKR